MWKANLTIIDEIANEEKKLIYRFSKICRYFNLLFDLNSHYPISEYISCDIFFTFQYLEQKIYIDDLTKYILNNDNIEIILVLFDLKNRQKNLLYKAMKRLFYFDQYRSLF